MMEGESSAKDHTNGRWTQEEHEKFLLGLELYGKNWKKIEEMIVTRNGSQIRSHAQKYFLKEKGKTNDPREDLENDDPNAFVQPNKSSKRKSKHKNILLPQLSAPNFWLQISEVLAHEHLVFWDLIDCQEREHQCSLQRKESFKVFEDHNRTDDHNDSDHLAGVLQTNIPLNTMTNCKQVQENKISN